MHPPAAHRADGYWRTLGISWWLYDAAPDYEVWTDDEKTKWCLKEPEALYDFIRDECQG